MRRVAVAGLLGLALVLTGCSPAAAPPPSAGPTPAVTSVHMERDVVYREVDGIRLALDACLPRPVRAAPALVLVHGGSFSGGTRGDLDFVCEAAAKAGVAAFSVDYRLLPARYPAQVQDVGAAVTWLAAPAQRRRFALRPDRTAILGASAGATIAAELATGTPGSPIAPDRLRAAVLLSGVYDTAGPLGALAPARTAYIGCADASPACTAAGRRVSAIDAVDRHDPPMLLVGSTAELTPLGQLRSFAAALQTAGVPHETLVEPGASHAEAVLVTAPASATTVLDFLRPRLFTAG